MRINNVSQKTSISSVIILAVFALLVTAGFVLTYFSTNTTDSYSVLGFISWYGDFFKSLQVDNSDGQFVPWIVMVALPLVAYIGFIGSIISRNKALKELNSSLNLKSVDFLPDRVNFNFNSPQYNFTCAYQDINHLKMVLKTVIVHSKHSSYPAVVEVELNFTVLNNKTFNLKNVPMNLKKFIFKTIDYGRAVQNFSYEFSGAGSIVSIEELIEDYLKFGCKQILTKQSEVTYKWFSIIFFIIGLFMLYSFKEELNDAGAIIWVVVGMFIILSFWFDIVLLADKWNESKYKGLNK